MTVVRIDSHCRAPAINGKARQWLPNCIAQGVGHVYRAYLRFSLHGKLLLPVVCILVTASCHKNSAKLFPAVLPGPATTTGSPTLPSAPRPTLSDRQGIQSNPN